MTPHANTILLTNEAFADLGGPDLVYVRPVKGSEVIGSAPAEAVRTFDLKPEQILYAVHRANGERLAVLTDRDSAYAAAFANELAPVSVH